MAAAAETAATPLRGASPSPPPPRGAPLCDSGDDVRGTSKESRRRGARGQGRGVDRRTRPRPQPCRTSAAGRNPRHSSRGRRPGASTKADATAAAKNAPDTSLGGHQSVGDSNRRNHHRRRRSRRSRRSRPSRRSRSLPAVLLFSEDELDATSLQVPSPRASAASPHREQTPAAATAREECRGQRHSGPTGPTWQAGQVLQLPRRCKVGSGYRRRQRGPRPWRRRRLRRRRRQQRKRRRRWSVARGASLHALQLGSTPRVWIALLKSARMNDGGHQSDMCLCEIDRPCEHRVFAAGTRGLLAAPATAPAAEWRPLGGGQSALTGLLAFDGVPSCLALDDGALLLRRLSGGCRAG